MLENDKQFTGTVPEHYDRHLRNFLFVPYAADLAQRLAGMRQGKVLEIACGTGAVTKELRERLPSSVSITATDLNSEMLAVARDRAKGAKSHSRLQMRKRFRTPIPYLMQSSVNSE